MHLAELHILAVDCQTTGANPDKGHLLEIGWGKTRAADAVDPRGLAVKSIFVRLPPTVDIPPAVQRVTGISNDALQKALPAADIWRKIVAAAREIAAADRLKKCPSVIHYARFEEPFLRHIHAQNGRKGAFPLRIICTHEIARRLLPGLPRKGLRAVAGYFGHSVPPLRRAAEHVAATAAVWRHLVRRLEEQHGITGVDQLDEWLHRTQTQKRPERVYPMKRQVRLNLPDQPGIYRMRRSNGDLLYIGKATSLKTRVNSYFGQTGVRSDHTLEMLSQAADLDVTPTGSSLEAAVLESDEIKRLTPPYNVALQKGRRTLVYCSRDLLHYSGRADRTHCIGPLPDVKLPAAMKALGTWHAGRRFADDELHQIGIALLGRPEAGAPPPDCLIEGLVLFHRRHRVPFQSHGPLRLLTGLGFALWRERLAALEQARLHPPEEVIEAETAGQKSESREAPAWTPEAVARAVEHRIMHGALLIRRSRWLCLLSESTLAWQARSVSAGAKNILLFENGAVSRRDRLPLKAETPAPRGYVRRMPLRREIFDIATYERLRVVTTELRRLVCEGRNVEIRLNPNSVLSRRHLAAILPSV